MACCKKIVMSSCHTSTKPGDELLIDRSLPDMALWRKTNMATARSENLEELARGIIHNVKRDETSYPEMEFSVCFLKAKNIKRTPQPFTKGFT